jgi:hypothetical protein
MYKKISMNMQRGYKIRVPARGRRPVNSRKYRPFWLRSNTEGAQTRHRPLRAVSSNAPTPTSYRRKKIRINHSR